MSQLGIAKVLQQRCDTCGGQNYHPSGNLDRDIRNKMTGTCNTLSKTDGKGGILVQIFSIMTIVLDLRNEVFLNAHLDEGGAVT